MLILGLLGMYFDAAVVFFTISSLLFRMAMAVLCGARAGADAIWPFLPCLQGRRNVIKLGEPDNPTYF